MVVWGTENLMSRSIITWLGRWNISQITWILSLKKEPIEKFWKRKAIKKKKATARWLDKLSVGYIQSRHIILFYLFISFTARRSRVDISGATSLASRVHETIKSRESVKKLQQHSWNYLWIGELQIEPLSNDSTLPIGSRDDSWHASPPRVGLRWAGQCLTKQSKVGTSFPLRKAFIVVLCESANQVW